MYLFPRCGALFTAFILTTSLASAQSPPAGQDGSGAMVTLSGAAIALADAEYNFYLVATRSSGQVLRVQSRMQLGDAEFQALLTHMRAVIAEANAFDSAQTKELCAKRQELTTMQKLGEALAERDRQKAARRAQLVQGTDKMIGTVGRTRLDALVAEFRANLVTSGIDPVKAAAVPGQDPAAILASTCRDTVSATR